MTESSIINELAQFIAKDILKQPRRAIQPGEPLISGGLVNSFSLIDLALHVEEEYGVVIADTELNAESFDTLEQLAAIILQRRH